MVEALRRKQNEELLLMLGEEQRVEERREEARSRATLPGERRQLDRRFGTERAKVSERIMRLTDRHEKELSTKMTELGLRDYFSDGRSAAAAPVPCQGLEGPKKAEEAPAVAPIESSPQISPVTATAAAATAATSGAKPKPKPSALASHVLAAAAASPTARRHRGKAPHTVGGQGA